MVNVSLQAEELEKLTEQLDESNAALSVAKHDNNRLQQDLEALRNRHDLAGVAVLVDTTESVKEV